MGKIRRSILKGRDMDRIENISITRVSGSNDLMIADKINELVDAHNGEDPRVLICSHCGSNEWEDTCSSTLMGGLMNYYTYTCYKCGKNTRVMRIKGNRDRRVCLGPEDEIQ
jgi:hypothetical protein